MGETKPLREERVVTAATWETVGYVSNTSQQSAWIQKVFDRFFGCRDGIIHIKRVLSRRS
jgi:hypothetical protein